MNLATRAVAFLPLLVSACGDGDQTDCVIAQAKLEQCDAEMAAMTSALSFRRLPLAITTDDGCSGENACVAACIKNQSCDTIDSVSIGGGVDPNRAPSQNAGAFESCLQGCFDRFEND